MEQKIKMKLKEQIDYNLRVPSFYKRTWKIIGLVTLGLLFLAGIPLIVIFTPTSETIVSSLNMNYSLRKASEIMSYVSFVLVVIPYIFLTAAWIVGIDNVTKSTNYNLLIWIVYSASALMSIIAIIIGFRAYLVI